MDVGELDGVLDDLDLLVEPADVRVGDVGDLLEHELLDFGSFELLEHESGLRFEANMVPGTEPDVAHRMSEGHDSFLIAACEHDEPVVREGLLDRDDLSVRFEVADVHDVERLVEDDFVSGLQLLDLHGGFHGDAELAAGRDDVDGPVGIHLEDGAERVRRCGELLDLFTQQRELLACLGECRRELVVLARGLRELVASVQEPLFEQPDTARSVLQASSQDVDLVLERPDRGCGLCSLSVGQR